MEPLSFLGSLAGLARSLFEGLTGIVSIVRPKLDLTYEAGKQPYFEVDQTVVWVAEPIPDTEGNSVAVQKSSVRRWFRVGIKNLSLETVDDVRVELASIEPPVIGHLPLQLSIMHGAQQPLSLHRAKEPTYFADVVLKLDMQDRLHIMSAPSPSGQGGLPSGRYRFGIRVTGRKTGAVTKHFVAEVDAEQRLVFSAD